MAIQQVGLWRAVMLSAMVDGYLDHSLQRTSYFEHLEPTEKAATSFLLSQAFTHWFAQTYMNMLHLIHVYGANPVWNPAGVGVIKQGALPPPQGAKPDFIGWDATAFHVFESKGRSNNSLAAPLRIGLGQVSRIASINGSAPATRVAACFAFLPYGVRGSLRDPPEEIASLSLKFDERLALRKAYAIFLEDGSDDRLRERIDGFACIQLVDGTVYGVDKEILELVRASVRTAGWVKDGSALITLLQRKKEALNRRADDETSVGPDGVILRLGA
jgi:hypothetical protein